MTTTTQELPKTAAPEFWNGHFRSQGEGVTHFDGPLENLPMPTGPVSIPQAIQAMYEDGYVIFPGAMSREEVAQWRARMDSRGEPDEKYVVPKWCFNKQLNMDFPKDPDSLDLIDRPGLFDVVNAIHREPRGGPPAVTGGSFWITGKGRRMGVHVDYQPICLPESIHEDPTIHVPIFTSTAHYYLNDMVAELGPTIVVPGSHKAGRWPKNECSWRGVTPKAVMVKAGDLMLFRGDIWHGAWMNSSDERRYLIQVHYGCTYYHRAFIPMAHSHLWSPEVLEKATPQQKMLLGAGKRAASY